MIEYDISYAAYMPCRITLVVDEHGKGWFVTMDLSVFIAASQMPDRLRQLAIGVRDSLMEIMEAGAFGEL